MSEGGENNWRLGGGMDILFILCIYLFIYYFFNNPFFPPRILVMVRYDLR